jgi:hypothetical protein
MTEALEIENARRHAEALIELLVDSGPLTSAECCVHLGWTKGRFSAALRAAREDLCATYGVAIPHPTPAEGWRYQVTTDWQPVERGAAYALGAVESRLHSVLRDVHIIKPALNPRSVEGRRANFLDKHLTHILGTLREITGD